LHLSPSAARLDIGEHLFQITHSGGQGLHLAQALMYQFQTFADLFERLTQTFFQGALKLFIYRLPHLFQLPGTISLHALQLSFHCAPEGLQFFLIGLGKVGDHG